MLAFDIYYFYRQCKHYKKVFTNISSRDFKIINDDKFQIMQLKNMDINSFLFIDEYEQKKDDNTKNALTLYLFGILIERNNITNIENQISELLKGCNKTKVHAVKDYKNIHIREYLSSGFTNLIDKNKLILLGFAFQKNRSKYYITNYKLKYSDIDLTNYRSLALILFIHKINEYIKKNNEHLGLCRIIVAEDWLKRNKMIIHEGMVLNNIENIYSDIPKNAPPLVLSDHFGYIFGKIKRHYDKIGLNLMEYLKLNTIPKTELFYLEQIIKLNKNNLFHFLE